MKKIFLITILSMLAVACGKKSGSGGTGSTGTYVGTGNPGANPQQPYYVFDVNMDLCGKGILQARPGTKMTVESARDYFRDYLINADRLRGQIGHSEAIEYNRYNGQPETYSIGTVTGYDMANGRSGSSHGWN